MGAHAHTGPDDGSDAVPSASALDGLRVLDLGGAMTNYASKLFAELGADVVLVEPLEGSDLRRQPPFADDVEDVEMSLAFFYRNTSKRGIAVDLDRPEGAEVLRRLATRTDLVLVDARQTTMAARGLSADSLIAGQPSLVVTSVTPFGQDGPYADYHDTDLVMMAYGGLLWMGGYTDGPPVRAVGDQAYTAGNLFAAVASMTAITHAELTGQGQHVDVSVQEAVTMGLENAAQFYDLEQHVRRRFGGEQRQAGFGVFPCADGSVFLIAAGIGGNRFWPNMIAWLADAGIADAHLLEGEQWADRDYVASEEAKDLFWRIFTEFSMTRTMKDLYRESQVWRVPLGPMNKPSDLYANEQLAFRDYFVDVEAFGRTVSIPGAPYVLTDTPWRLRGPAPRLGEHTDAVLAEAGFATDDIAGLRAGEVVR